MTSWPRGWPLASSCTMSFKTGYGLQNKFSENHFFCKNQRISSTLIHVLIESKSLCIWWRILFLLSPKLFLNIGYLFLFLSLSYAHTCILTHTVRLFFNITSSNAQQSIAQTHTCISLLRSLTITKADINVIMHSNTHAFTLAPSRAHKTTLTHIRAGGQTYTLSNTHTYFVNITFPLNRSLFLMLSSYPTRSLLRKCRSHKLT